MTQEEIVAKLKKELNQHRYMHTVGVSAAAMALAERYGADPEKAKIAALLHDCAKNVPTEEAIVYCHENDVFLKDICYYEPSLIHAYHGAHLAKVEYGIDDEEILHAIYYHTTGCDDMSLLDKIIYVADAIEPLRTQAGVENLRKIAFEDIDEAVIRSVDATVRHIINKGGMLDTDTIAARNALVLQKKRTKGDKWNEN